MRLILTNGLPTSTKTSQVTIWIMLYQFFKWEIGHTYGNCDNNATPRATGTPSVITKLREPYPKAHLQKINHPTNPAIERNTTKNTIIDDIYYGNK